MEIILLTIIIVIVYVILIVSKLKNSQRDLSEANDLGDASTTRRLLNENFEEAKEMSNITNEDSEHDSEIEDSKFGMTSLISKQSWILGNLIYEGKVREAIVLGEEALLKCEDQESIAGIYINLMVAYFKLRKEEPLYFDKSTYCAKMAILFGHRTGYAHERLAINLEKTGELHQAIQLCDLVLHPKFKFSKSGCGNNMDFSKRRNRIVKKLDKAKDSETSALFTDREIDMILSFSEE